MWLVSHLLPERYQNSVFFQKLFVTDAKYETQEKQTLVPASNNGNSDVYITCRALFIWGKFNLTKLNQYITLPCNTINHFSSQLFLRQEILLQNNSVVQANLTCIFMELHPPRRPMMCHDRIVCKIKPHKLRSDFIS
jgi:predicted aspartyl protease